MAEDAAGATRASTSHGGRERPSDAVTVVLQPAPPPNPGKGWRRFNTHCTHGHLLTGKRHNTRDDRRGKVYTMRYCVFCARRRKLKSGKGIAWRRQATCCPKGHPYEGDNLGIQVCRDKGRERETRLCITCRRESQKRYRDNRRARRVAFIAEAA